MTLAAPLDLVRRLIATPSVSSRDPAFDVSNVPVCDLLSEWAEDVGFRVERMDVPGKPGKQNVIATLGDGPGGLILSGHTDTVPWDDGAWDFDPFGGVERDGRLYGLGSADMKGFLALAVHAVEQLDLSSLREPIVVLGTADEESTMSGARALVAAGRTLGRVAVIGEPTSLRPVHAHKGMFMETLRLTGRAGHSSNPALGNSALEGMHEAIAAILAVRETIAGDYRDDEFEVPTPTLNLGHIEGGDSPNRICGRCALSYDFRALPGMDVAASLDRVRSAVRAVAEARGLGVSFEPLFDGVPPYRASGDTLVRLTEELSGNPAGAVAFATEAPFLTELGLETVVLGPGSIDVAHQPNEYLPLDSVAPTVRLVQELVSRVCL